MNFFQRLFVRAAAWIAPPLGKLLRSTGGTIERAQAEISELRERNNIRRQQIQDEQQELREAIQMIAPAWLPPVARLTAATSESLRESGAPGAVIKCVERLWELELALEDRGWVRELTLANFEFSLFGIHRIIAICRLFHIKNPLIRRGIQVCSFYVFGRGVTISSDDDDTNQVLQDFFTSPKNIQEVGHCALVRKNEAMWTDGNLYVIFFRDQKTGELVIRSLDPIEIVEIVHDPDDASQEQFIHRRWMSQQFDVASGVHRPVPAEVWYPALGYDPDVMPDKIGNIEVSKDTPVDHVKVGAMANWQYGVPLAYPAIDYARAVRKLIDNWCSIQEAMARFSWQVETQGGLPAIANLKATLATTLATGDGSMYEQNPPPTAAAAWISGPGNKLSMSKTSGMIDSPEIGRRVAHLVYMVFGLPETFFADASVGTVATATSLDRPTELKFKEDQARWREILQKWGGYAVESSKQSPSGRLSEAKTKSKPKPKTPPKINVDWPSILEHEILSQIQAITQAATLGGFECTGMDERLTMGLLMQEFGVENWQDVLELMYPEKDYDPLMDRTPLLAQQQDAALNPPPAPAMGGAPPNTGPTGMPTPNPAKPAAGQPPETPTGAPPQAPMPKKPHAKHMTGAESAQLARAVASLQKAAILLKERANGSA
jgi:hypothetical protein